MYLISRQNEGLLCRLLYRFMSSGKKSHYEVLNLSRTCSDKEIKEAFIRMSKKLHPDKNQGGNSHEEFVRVLEAYSVLGKPQLRAQYDVRPLYEESAGAGAGGHQHAGAHQYTEYQEYTDAAGSYGRKRGPRKFYTDFHYEQRHTSGSEAARPYYGVKGVKRRNNMTVLLVCLAVASVGVFLQLLLITNSFRFTNKVISERSKRNAQHLERVKAMATMNGNELQTQLLLKKVSDASSPKMATAALAETLTNKPK